MPRTLSGSITIAIRNFASVRALETSRSRSSVASAWNPERACSPRPKALSTRIPCTDSSTRVATSPAWSWAEREKCTKRWRNRGAMTMIGTAAMRKIRASSGDRLTMRTKPTSTLITEVTNMTEPKANQRRSMLRSAIARDCSWPAPHSAWKREERSWSVLKSWTRMRVSASEATGSTKNRRMYTSPASRTPNASMTPAATHTARAAASSSRTELISTWSTCGILNATTPAPTAESSPSVHRIVSPCR